MYFIGSCYFIGIAAWEQIKPKLTNANLVVAFSALLVVILAGIRYEVGTDYITYFNAFQGLLQDPNFFPQFEVGWCYITYFLSYVGFDVYGIFAFWACVAILPFYYGLQRYSPYPLFSFCCFFLVYNAPCLYNFMRQTVVMGILIGSIGLIKERRHVPLFFIFLFAVSIHRSAIILLLFYFLIEIKSIEKYRYAILIAAFTLGWFSVSKTLLLHLSPLVMPGSIIRKIEAYFVYRQGGLDVVNILQRMFVLVPALIFYKPLVRAWKYNEVTIGFYFWGCVVYFLLADSYDIATRLNTTTKILDIIIVPSFLCIAKGSVKILLFVLIILWGVSVLYAFLFMSLHSDCYYPFRTIFAS